MLGQKPELTDTAGDAALLAGTLDQPEIAGLIDKNEAAKVDEEGYLLRTVLTGGSRKLVIAGTTSKGVLYGVFHFLRILQTRGRIDTLSVIENPANKLRMINHWDNMDGSIERGYAGGSIFYRDHAFIEDLSRVRDYARLMAAVQLNAVVINNVNVHETETKLITKEFLPQVARVAEVFRAYGIRLYLSINFAAPIQAGGLRPLIPSIRR